MTQDLDYAVTISPGAVVVYLDNGEEAVGIVRSVDTERELIEVAGVPGVLRPRDIHAVGVFGDEAIYDLCTHTNHDRITESAP